MLKLELLAPAKDLESAIAAVNCGADAVYIGAPRFSARAQAGNNIPDIEKAIQYGRPYHAKTYVALNTLLKDDELEEAERYIKLFYEMGADGVIVQDMGILEMDLPPIPLIASTQCNNETADQVKFLEEVGFKRAILARELSLDQIRDIRSKTKIELESFIHGALCVSYSGQCFMSCASGGRSGNRGVCAQPCRLTYSLVDSDGTVISKNKHLLSTKDLNLSGSLGDLIDAGITSFKIEGRLKDIHYIKNVVSWYRKALDKAMEGKDCARSSDGKSFYSFTPDLKKTFNRGYTEYFIHGRKESIASINTQKSLGEPIGKVKKVFTDYFTLEGDNPLHNADGVCFFDKDEVLAGMFINRVDNEKIFPKDNRFIFEGAFLYRNQDHEFEKELKSARIERKIGLKARFFESKDGFILNLTDETGVKAETELKSEKVPAEKPEMAEENIRKQLMKFGDTAFTATDVEIRTGKPYFIPVKDLNELRRNASQLLLRERIKISAPEKINFKKNDFPYREEDLSYLGNVLNKKAEEFYRRHGVKTIEPAAESGLDMSGRKVMTTKHCLKYEFGMCAKYNGKQAVVMSEPLFLTEGNQKYRLEFDCRECKMNVYKS